MRTDIYICSKPLQYFNIRNIPKRSVDSECVLIILGLFSDAEDFYQKVKSLDRTWGKILFFSRRVQVYKYLFFHPANRLFVEIDASFVYGLYSKLGRFKQLYVFEEGFGSYRRDRFDQSKGLKRIINNWTGVGLHVGFSDFLTGQYLYFPELYKQQFPYYSKLLMTFGKTFVDRLQEELPFFLQLSSGYEEFLSVTHQNIGIYLTNHRINENILQYIEGYKSSFDLLFMKPHPHICSLKDSNLREISVIHTNIMVEFMLIVLLNNGNHITVFHENSTSMIWFQNQKQIVDRNLGEEYEEYDAVISYVRNMA